MKIYFIVNLMILCGVSQIVFLYIKLAKLGQIDFGQFQDGLLFRTVKINYNLIIYLTSKVARANSPGS